MSRWFTDYEMGGAALDKNDASVVCLGNFDGVHQGHRGILMRARDEAKRRHHKSIIFTFSPHPSKILRAGDSGVSLILNPQEKKDLLDFFDFDFVINQRFDRDFTLISAEDFANRVLKSVLKCSAIVVGENFHFGYQAKGNAALLSSLKVFDVFAEVAVRDSSKEVISSTRVRLAISSGQMERAEEMLGYPYFVSGRVVHGDGRGRQIGFPTLNLQFKKECRPAHGVYAAFVQFLDEPKKMYPAAVNWGSRPTVDGVSEVLEAHLLNRNEDLYGREVRVFFKKKVRDEVRFASVSQLQAQISEDIVVVQDILNSGSLLDIPLQF